MPRMSAYFSGWGIRFWSANVGSLDAQHKDDRFMLAGRPSSQRETTIKDWYEDVNHRCAAYVELHLRKFQREQTINILANLRGMNLPGSYDQLFVGRRQVAVVETPGNLVPVELSCTIINLPGDVNIPIIVRLAAKGTSSPSLFFEGMTISLG